MKIRTRFAPSPTGFIHVGNIRTALFAWILARQNSGQFILRLEDTDKKREVASADQHIMDCLRALCLNYDEGPDIGGSFAPYRQSERLDIYKKWANKLIEQGRAYADPYSANEVQTFREATQASKKPFLYRNYRPENPPEWDGTTPLRFRSDPKNYQWHDEVMGDLKTGPEVIDDIVLIKSDGYPTYNFAHIVDDVEMQISHIIRGQEFLASTPNYLNLYEALNIDKPILATMPHILAETGGKKLSKRDGSKDVLEYLREGYLPEAMINFIATLGWNDGTEQEIFSVDELIEKFSLSHVQKSGARFDEKRLLWLNGQHIRKLSLDDLYTRINDKNFWPDVAKGANETYKKQVLTLAQDRLKTLADLPVLTSYFFAEPKPNWPMIEGNKQLKKIPKNELQDLLKAIIEALTSSDFTIENLQETLNKLLDQTKQKPAILFGLIRLSLTWAPFSPGLAETMNLLGQTTTLARLTTASQI